jgi:FkbM family methyltransferase
MIFDVGAYHGEWATAANVRFANAVIHAFEITPTAYKYLEDIAHKIRHIRPNPFGLSDHTGSADVGVWQNNDTVSSIFWDHSIRSEHGRSVIRCAVRRADEYCRDQSITQIDILKIDVEGAEPLVLRGFGKLWDDGHIGLVQFEYGMANIYSRHLLIDFWRDFQERDYMVGKLMPNTLEFTNFSPYYEDFRGPNYVAVHKSRTDFLEAFK